MFCKDRDLLVLEPMIFRDAAWSGQRLCRALGTMTAGVLTLTDADVTLADAGIGPGHVVLVGETPFEVITVTGASTLTISRLRVHDDDAAVPPGDTASATLTNFYTFAPQIGVVHAQVLRMVGIDPDDTHEPAPATPTASDITNPRTLARLEALGALHLIYTAAGALTPISSPLNARAELYRGRFSRERERVRAHIDLNGDGAPDVERALNVAWFVRA